MFLYRIVQMVVILAAGTVWALSFGFLLITLLLTCPIMRGSMAVLNWTKLPRSEVRQPNG